jgi:protein-tyrosine phosphatase
MNSAEIRTSASHPIYVDWLPVALRGRVGLTFAPGKKAASKYSGGRWERDLHADLDRLVTHFEMHTLVSLIEDRELEQYGITDLYAQTRARSVRVDRLPIRDVSVPTLRTDVDALVLRIIEDAESGRNVVIHCIGGLGRTGTVAGCVLVELGLTSAQALEVLHALRGPHCPETRAQEQFIAAHRPSVRSRGTR